MVWKAINEVAPKANTTKNADGPAFNPGLQIHCAVGKKHRCRPSDHGAIASQYGR